MPSALHDLENTIEQLNNNLHELLGIWDTCAGTLQKSKRTTKAYTHLKTLISLMRIQQESIHEHIRGVAHEYSVRDETIRALGEILTSTPRESKPCFFDKCSDNESNEQKKMILLIMNLLMKIVMK